MTIDEWEKYGNRMCYNFGPNEKNLIKPRFNNGSVYCFFSALRNREECTTNGEFSHVRGYAFESTYEYGFQ